MCVLVPTEARRAFGTVVSPHWVEGIEPGPLDGKSELKAADPSLQSLVHFKIIFAM